jgi:hypothetical protein
MKRIAIAAIAGGVIVFIWGAISHMLLPFGSMGFSTLPNEDAVTAALKSSIPDEGLYIFPGIDMSGDATEEEQAAWAARLRSGPRGLLVYHPQGSEPMSPRQLLSELLANVLAAAVAAFLVSLMAAAYGRRVLAVALLGLFGWLSLEVSFWIWYGFPGSFIAAEAVTEVVGWFLAGLAIARIVPPAGTAVVS